MSEDQQPKYNPLGSTDSIDVMLQRRQEKEKQELLLKEEIEEYRVVLNRLFSSPDGQYFLKKLIKYCGIYLFDNAPPDGRLAEEKGKRKVYLELIRPYLHTTVRQQVDN